ncbi:MAG: GNAT family N-acetyltransferase [candidate division WOR-3 bacterium]
MNIEILPLTEENLKDAPEWNSHPFSCKYCIYWEFPEECLDPMKEKKEVMFQKKLSWIQKAKRILGNCGLIAYLEGKPIGYAQYAFSKLLPNSKNYPVKPNDDAVLISCLFIPKPKLRRQGIGSRMLQFIINELKNSGVNALETFARKDKPDNPSGPVDFYLKNGFIIYKDDATFPLMRLEL